MIDKIISDIETEVKLAINRQTQMNRDIEILQAKALMVGEYRVKFIDILDKFKKMRDDQIEKKQGEMIKTII